MTLNLKTFVYDFLWVIKYMISIIMYSISIILIIVAILVGAYFVDKKLNARNGVDKPPLYSAYVILTTSMTPVINAGDAIIVRRNDALTFEVGDVITYKSTEPSYYGILITHRIIEIYDEDGVTKYLTKGDYNQTPDPNGINPDQIYGKVVMRIPKIGFIRSFLSSFWGWIIAIILPCLYIIISTCVGIVKNLKNSRREKRLQRRQVMLNE